MGCTETASLRGARYVAPVLPNVWTHLYLHLGPAADFARLILLSSVAVRYGPQFARFKACLPRIGYTTGGC